MKSIIQTPSIPSNWLHNNSEKDRIFSKSICRPENTPAWPECTDAEKQAWEESHRPDEPQQAEEQATE